MKLAQYYMEQIGGIEIFPIIGLFIFLLFALIMGIWVFKLDKNFIHKMSNIPLGLDEEKENTI